VECTPSEVAATAAATEGPAKQQQQEVDAGDGITGADSCDEFLPFDGAGEQQLFDARTAPAGHHETISGTAEEDVCKVVDLVASFEGVHVAEPAVITRAIKEAIRAIEVLRETGSVLREWCLPRLAFFVRDLICERFLQPKEEDPQQLLVQLINALGVNESGITNMEMAVHMPIVISVLGSACRLFLPVVSGFLGVIATRLPCEDIARIDDSEAIAIAEFIKEFCSAGGSASLRSSEIVCRSLYAV
jgi:hypothetical protein